MAVNPKCIDDYAVLEWKNLTKLHIFAAKRKVNTYREKLFPSDVSVKNLYFVKWDRCVCVCEGDDIPDIGKNTIYVKN